MSIAYSDGKKIETLILESVQEAHRIDSSTDIASEKFNLWPFRYHLSSERGNLIRHLNFSSANVLEIGAGMGAISRVLAENARSLFVVEGTQERFNVLKSRLRDLNNWDGWVGNLQEFHPTRKFDVVCVIGVLEYSELYITPPAGFNGSPFDYFLKRALDFLSDDGVIVLAIENQLGVKYLSGCGEDHTDRLFDGLSGYSFRRGPKTFTKRQLTQMMLKAGFQKIISQFPFPDYKIPRAILSETLIENYPNLACDLANSYEFSGYGPERAKLFPEYLAMKTFAEENILSSFSNSFLFLASKNSNSKRLSAILNECEPEKPEEDEEEFGWYYSFGREKPTKTVFVRRNGLLFARKVLVGNKLKNFQLGASKTRWQSIEEEVVQGENYLKYCFTRQLYFGEWDSFLDQFKDFLNWSFIKWKTEESNSLRGEAVDAIWKNTIVVDGGYELFDLEWIQEKNIRKSLFVLRNIIAFGSLFDLLSPQPQVESLRALYTRMCDLTNTPANLDEDLKQESQFQSECSTNKDAENIFYSLLALLDMRFQVTYPRHSNDILKMRHVFDLRKKPFVIVNKVLHKMEQFLTSFPKMRAILRFFFCWFFNLIHSFRACCRGAYGLVNNGIGLQQAKSKSGYLGTVLGTSGGIGDTAMTEKIKNLARSISYSISPQTISEIQRYRFLRTEALKLAPHTLPDLSFEERFRRIQETPFLTQQIESEFVLALKKVADLKPKVVVEIGAFQGGTLALFTQVAPSNGRFLSIDIAFEFPQTQAFRKFATKQQEVRCIRGDSSNVRVREKVKKWLGNSKIDVLFIDGDHSYRGVKADFENYSPMVRAGGIVLFHDIVEDYTTRYGKPTPSYTGGVPQFWKELKSAGYVYEEFIENSSQDGFGIGLLKK